MQRVDGNYAHESRISFTQYLLLHAEFPKFKQLYMQISSKRKYTTRSCLNALRTVATIAVCLRGTTRGRPIADWRRSLLLNYSGKIDARVACALFGRSALTDARTELLRSVTRFAKMKMVLRRRANP